MTGQRTPPPYAVIIVSYGSRALLERTAATLTLPGDGSIIVVDCFSTIEEREAVQRLAERHGWRPVLLDTNAGYGGGTNAGARVALAGGATVLVPLNPDATIDAGSLETLVLAAADDPMLLASPRIISADGSTWFAGADLYMEDGRIRSASKRDLGSAAERREWATGACFAVSEQLWNTLGGFDEEYFLYWEDVDFSHRALDAGARLAVVDATVVHDAGGTQREAGSQEGRAKSEIYYYSNIRNRMLYAAKHLDADAIRRWRKTDRAVAWEILMRGGRKQLLQSVEPWRALARGLKDGRAIARKALRRLDRKGGA